MFGGTRFGSAWMKRSVSVLCILAYAVGLFEPLLTYVNLDTTREGEAAQSTIDSAPSAAATSHIQSGAQTVFVSDQTGYKFYIDAPGYCVYRKTTDGGATWSSTTTVDAQTDCVAISVWYDRWTPGSASSSIHIATLDTSSDIVWYNRLDTSGDTLLLGDTPVNAAVNSSQTGTITAGQNQVSITRGTNGTLYIASIDATDSYVVRCTVTCNTTTNWTEAGTNPFGRTNNYTILAPLLGGNILAIHRDVVLEDMGSKVYDAGTNTWDTGTTTFDLNALDNTTYDVGMAMTVSSTTGTIYLAYAASNTTPGFDDLIRTARYSGGSWTTGKEVVRYTEKGITNVAIALDQSNDDIYVAYTARTLPTVATSSNVYWKKSTDNMASWSYEYGPIDNSIGDLYGLDLNIMSDERMYASWYDLTNTDLYGETLADIFPGIHVTTNAFDETNSTDSYTQITLDTTAHANGTSNLMSGAQTVFVSDQVGYKFYRDAPGYCVYRKTTDGGGTWSGTTTVDSQTDCHQITVWYDGWTPGLASSSIHILTADAGADDLWYNRLNTSDDTLLLGSTPVNTTASQGGSLTEAENYVSITRATNGVLYIVSNDGTTGPDSFIMECTVTCSSGTNWSETGTNPLDAASDQNLLLPLMGDDLLLINRDISADDIRARTWDDSAATWTPWTTIDLNAPENATYDVGMAAALSTTTGMVYLAYLANNDTLGTNDEVRTAVYGDGSWTTRTAVSTSTVLGLTNVALELDYATDDVYVAYSARATAGTAGTANILWKRSQDDMATWGYEQGPINTGPDDIYGVDLALLSNERIYGTWYDATDDDIYGATLVNLPYTPPQTLGDQIASTTASTTNFYVGGTFALYNATDVGSLDVTGVVVSESGSIDAFTDMANIRLYYESDTSSPYDCASETYGGGESQFGSTDTNGFSGADGVSGFTGTSVSVSTTTSLCLYVVVDILDSALSSSTIELSINDPSTDITVSSGTAGPASSIITPRGSTFVYNDTPTLTHFHWRNDDGTQATSTSRTSGIEDTALTALLPEVPVRLRMQVSNEGSTATPMSSYQLEYGTTTSSCDATTLWTAVSVTGDFMMYDSLHLVHGTNTTNISTTTGGVTDENLIFKTPNGGVLDTSAITSPLSLSPLEFVELEYSIMASSSVAEGTSYCFRVTDAGYPLSDYTVLPRVNIAADVLVTATSSQISATTTPVSNFYIGGSYVMTENVGSRDIETITITENGTVDGATGLDNIKLRYDLDTSLPYNCVSESFNQSDTQFGSTDTDGFSGQNGTSTFSDTVTISTTATLCLYVVVDTTPIAQNGETIDIILENPSINVTVSSGSVGPTVTRDITGSTTLAGPVLTQTHYHWRNDNGTQATATSMTSGNEDTAVTNIATTLPVRLRMQVSNEGSVTTTPGSYRLEYGAKITTCSAIGSWTDVGATGGAWDMYDSIHLIEATNTTNIATSTGGLTDENTTFKTPNSAVKDTSSVVATTTLGGAEFLEAEFSLLQTANSGFNVTYCFRLTHSGNELNSYLKYPELTSAPERDFEIQRGTATIPAGATSTTLVAGVDYVAPSASTSAFMRITNVGMTGAGHNTGNTLAQNATNTTAYLLNPANIMNSVTIHRTGVSSSTRVAWEIVEFVGAPGSDNEMIVRAQSSLIYATASTSATSTTVSGVVNDNDIVVFITGQQNPDTASTNYDSGLSTSEWNASIDRGIFRRGSSGSDAGRVSYAVVEFTGQNWNVQRVEHTYTSAGVTETEPITLVNDTERAFLHTQKRNTTGLNGTDEFGHEVWLSSMGFVSFFLQSGATTPSGQTSVAWIIENVQTSEGAMVVTRSNDATSGGTAPLTVSKAIGKTLTDLTNASIFTNARSSGAGTTFPASLAAVTIASTTHYELWRSNISTTLTYRTEIVEWPTAGLALRHGNYQFYVDNNALLPTDPWPAGGTDIGENTVIGPGDEPLGEGERLRLRMTLRVLNATLPTSTKAFKLQFAPLTSSCTAVSESSWQTLGNSASSTVWRGYSATGTTDGTVLGSNPPLGGELKTSSADVPGTLEEENDSEANPFAVPEGDEIEYDWYIEQNGANAETYYCFRMIESDGTLLSNYLPYPQVRTASFTPRTQDWRWFSDEYNETPTSSLAEYNTAPVDIPSSSTLALRITVAELKNIARDDVRFKVQYSEYANFAVPIDVVATSTCSATSTWCYANGAGVDNAVVSSTTLQDTDICTLGVGDGCGTHNESPSTLTGYRHENSAAAEYQFTLKSATPRVNTVYYFRLYDLTQDIPVPTNDGEEYPSLVTEGASLTFGVGSVASGTVLEGVTVDIGATATGVPFGKLTIGNDYEAAQQFVITTNSPEGYRLYMTTSGELQNAMGSIFEPLTGTNASPLSWNTACGGSAPGCFGYHTGDDTLEGGSTRFAPDDTYARFSTTTLDEVLYTGGPVTGETVNIIYRIKARPLQAAGQYTTNIRYIAVPTF